MASKYKHITVQGPIYMLGDEKQERAHYFVYRCTDTTEFKPGDVLSQEQVDATAKREDLSITIEPWR